jgi:hypothetical protein
MNGTDHDRGNAPAEPSDGPQAARGPSGVARYTPRGLSGALSAAQDPFAGIAPDGDDAFWAAWPGAPEDEGCTCCQVRSPWPGEDECARCGHYGRSHQGQDPEPPGTLRELRERS